MCWLRRLGMAFTSLDIAFLHTRKRVGVPPLMPGKSLPSPCMQAAPHPSSLRRPWEAHGLGHLPLQDLDSHI